jgi:7-cyano-7-deazaguanine reductase
MFAPAGGDGQGMELARALEAPHAISMPGNTYKTDGSIDSFANPHPGRDYEIEFVTDEFTCVCPMTGLPDFGTITLVYAPADLCVELRSLKYYLLRWRNRGIFYEDVVNRILDDVVEATAPRRCTVVGEFNARGGFSARVSARYPAG